MVSVLLATTGRPDMAEACVSRVLQTTEGHEVEVVAAVDADPVTADRLLELGAEVAYSPTLRGPSRAWNAALGKARGDQLVLAADDLEWGEGWLTEALAALEGFPGGWGFVGFNDGHWGAELSTHFLVSRRLIVEEFGGVIAWECYHHSFNDLEANERARRAGRYVWCEGAFVYHRHWIFGERPQDETDARLLGLHEESERRYHERRAAGFPNDFEAVIA